MKGICSVNFGILLLYCAEVQVPTDVFKQLDQPDLTYFQSGVENHIKRGELLCCVLLERGKRDSFM